jgi:hypothetical protein
MALTADQKITYERMRQTALSELEALDQDIAAELSRTKKRLLELQDAKKALKQIFDGASARLGLNASAPLKELNLSDLKHAGEGAIDVQSDRPAPTSVS